MDVANINAFTEVIVSTFETSCGAAPYRCKDYEQRTGDIVNHRELMCVIDIEGTLRGTVVMTFPAETANKIYGAMMMEDIHEFNEEVAEGFSEILNMIIGNVKATLTEQKLEFKPPQAIVGKDSKFENQVGVPWLYIPMLFKDLGRFELFISMKEGG